MSTQEFPPLLQDEYLLLVYFYWLILFPEKLLYIPLSWIWTIFFVINQVKAQHKENKKIFLLKDKFKNYQINILPRR